MNQEPYSPPQSLLASPEDIIIPNSIKNKIKHAWAASLISIVITIGFILVSLSGTNILGLDATGFIDVGFMAIFAFGIYKNSRMCAVLMLIFFAANKILILVKTGSLSGFPMAVIFLWFYIQGVIGTF